MKNQYLFTLLITFLSFSVVLAQDEEEESSPVTISGSVDAYFRANLSAPNKINPVIDRTFTTFFIVVIINFK